MGHCLKNDSLKNEVEEEELVEETASDLIDELNCSKSNLKNERSKSRGSVKVRKYNSEYLHL